MKLAECFGEDRCAGDIIYTKARRRGVLGSAALQANTLTHGSEDNPKLAVDEALETIKHWRLSLFFGFTVFKFYL